MPAGLKRHFGFLKTTLIGGLVFLLPLIVVGFVVGQIVPIVLAVAKFLNETFGFQSAVGYLVLLAISVAVIVLLCFAAGLVARWTIGKRIGSFVERHLTLIFPRYSIYKDQLAGGVGGDVLEGRMKPILVEIDGVTRLAMEIERTADKVVTVYLPGSPDPWSGSVCFLPEERVRAVNADVGQVMDTFEKLGRGATAAARITYENVCSNAETIPTPD